MNKKIGMFIICVVFALISSCKNYADLKQGVEEQVNGIKQGVEQKVKGFLEAKKEELTEGLKNFGSEVSSKVKEELMQADEPKAKVQEQVAQDVNNENQEVEALKKKIEELKKKIEGADGDKTTLGTYSDYEKELETLKDKKAELEKELKEELEKSKKELKEKKEKRKKALEDAQKKFEGYKSQVNTATGATYGQRAGNQGTVGQQAFKDAKELGLNVSYSGSTDTSDMSSGIIEGALKKIEEELNNSIEDFREDKKE
ncbi:hypothetical protein QIA27_06380 (plasmid) [Borreliella tanukii]|uniref:hypothetical protein n=1 Tax=Borreliella tanukii TaxID=56146 RepID=UPI003AF085E3